MSKMFTIEQAGGIKKVNTIDELIIEYIRKYSCQAGVGSGSNINVEEIKKMLEPYALSTDLFEFLKTEEFNKEILNYVSNKELENEYRKKDDLSYKDTTLLTTTVANEKYSLKDDIPTIVNSQKYDESSTTNDIAVPTVKLVENIVKSNIKEDLFTFDQEKNSVVMANTDNSKYVSLESNYGDPALKIINYASSYNEVKFGLTHSTFTISDDSNKDFLRYDKIDKKTYLLNPHNINFEPLLTEVAADNKYETKEIAEEKYALKTDIPTVDLEPYALKTDIPDLEQYRKKDNLKAGTISLPIETKKFVFEADKFDHETSHAKYQDGVYMKGKAKCYHPRENTYVEEKDFELTYKETYYYTNFEPQFKLHKCEGK